MARKTAEYMIKKVTRAWHLSCSLNFICCTPYWYNLCCTVYRYDAASSHPHNAASICLVLAIVNNSSLVVDRMDNKPNWSKHCSLLHHSWNKPCTFLKVSSKKERPSKKYTLKLLYSLVPRTVTLIAMQALIYSYTCTKWLWVLILMSAILSHNQHITVRP